MPDKELTVGVKIKGDSSEGKEVAATLDQVSQAGSKNSESTNEQTRSTGFLGLKTKELKKSLKELAQGFPEVAMAARAAMNPTVAAVSLAIGIFVKAKAALTEWNKELDEFGEKAAQGFGDMGSAMRDANAEIREASIDLTHFLTDAAKAQERLATKTNDSTDAIKAQAVAMLEVNNAAEAAIVAEINRQQKAGKISEPTAIKLRAYYKTQFAHQADQIHNNADQKTIEEKENQLKETEKRVFSIEEEMENSWQLANDPDRKARIKNYPKVRGRLEAELADAQKAVDEQSKKVSQAESDLSRATPDNEASDPTARANAEHLRQEAANKLARENSKLRDLGQDRDRVQLAINHGDSNNENRQLQQKELDARSAAAQKNWEGHFTTIEKLKHELEQLKLKAAQDKDTRTKVGGFKDQESAANLDSDLKDARGKNPLPSNAGSGPVASLAELKRQQSIYQTAITRMEAALLEVESGGRSPFGNQADILRKLENLLNGKESLDSRINSLNPPPLNGSAVQLPGDHAPVHRAVEEAGSAARDVATHNQAAAQAMINIGQSIAGIATGISQGQAATAQKLEKLNTELQQLKRNIDTTNSRLGTVNTVRGG